MNLTLFFIVLSIGIGYLLYDMFKKSKQNINQGGESVSNQLKVNYAEQCAVLHELRKKKIDTILPKTLSINLFEGKTDLTEQQANTLASIFKQLKTTHRIYLLQNIGHQYSNLFSLVAEVLGQEYVIPYHSAEGAVAILRQLSCGIHLESNQQVFHKIKQYIPKIWYVGNDPDQQALRQFKDQAEMLEFLTHLLSVEK